MKISELVRLITSVWFKEYAVPVIDTDTFELIYPQITGDMEIEDSFKNIITVKKVETNSHLLDLKFGKLFTVELYIDKFPYVFAPTSMFHEQIYLELLKIGWVKTVYATITLGQSGLKCASDRRGIMEMLVARAIHDGIPEMLLTVLNTDWHKLSYDFQTETHTFMKNGTDFQVYGEMSNDWIKDFITESFEAMLKDCQSNNFIECTAILLDWKKTHIPDDKEEIKL
jgi:hypothetical protein